MITFVIIKPDAIERGLIGKIIQCFEDMHLKIIRIGVRTKNESWLKRNYSIIHKDLIDFMTNTPLIGIVLEGDDAVYKVKSIVGCITGPPLGTIRHTYGAKGMRNLVHVSESVDSALNEVYYFFGGNK